MGGFRVGVCNKCESSFTAPRTGPVAKLCIACRPIKKQTTGACAECGIEIAMAAVGPAATYCKPCRRIVQDRKSKIAMSARRTPCSQCGVKCHGKICHGCHRAA